MSEVSLFNNKNALAQGWYVIARSTEVKKGRVIPKSLLGMNFAVFRTVSGKVGVMLGKCPHMGANVAYGRVEGESVVCPFHGMQYARDGKCTLLPSQPDAKDRFSATAFEVDERWGQIWFHLGKVPRYRLDVFHPQVNGMDQMLFSRSHYPLHHHVMIPNALDFVHFDVVHGMESSRFDFSQNELSLRADIKFELTERAPKIMKTFGIKSLELIFETFGANNYLVQIFQPYRMSFLTNYSPDGKGGTISSSAAFFPKKNKIFKLSGVPLMQRAFQMLFVNAFFADDTKVTSHIDFQPKFLPKDKYYIEFVKHCSRLKSWPEDY
ncbi:MAG: Rieske 2Fe-2S domain-containing protein [Oligoflexia bacterium]|nr:Rieske 2Fe-2S domain-containing protein [Oligoflexia bacterium]